MVAYLRVTFACLGALPPASLAAVHFASCAYVHANLRAALLDTTDAPASTSSPPPISSSASSSSSSGSGDGSSSSSSPPLSPPLSSGGCVRVNALALHGLRLDVLGLEAFAAACARELPDAAGLPHVFAPLRQLLDALLDRGAKHVLGHGPTRRALHPQLDCTDAVAVLTKVVGLPALARLKLLSAGSSRAGAGAAAAAELPSLDKKQAAELIKLLQTSGA